MMNDNELTWEEVPEGWALCFNQACAMRERCLRWQAGLLAPENLTVGRCVTPRALKDGQCQCFATMEKVRIAYGFSTVYDEVRKSDYTPMRKELTFMLSGKRYYYEYMRGERPLSPAQQESIREFFAKWGYADSVKFDRYEEHFVFEYV